MSSLFIILLVTLHTSNMVHWDLSFPKICPPLAGYHFKLDLFTVGASASQSQDPVALEESYGEHGHTKGCSLGMAPPVSSGGHFIWRSMKLRDPRFTSPRVTNLGLGF
jgi:hypothetical protein